MSAGAAAALVGGLAGAVGCLAFSVPARWRTAGFLLVLGAALGTSWLSQGYPQPPFWAGFLAGVLVALVPVLAVRRRIRRRAGAVTVRP